MEELIAEPDCPICSRHWGWLRLPRVRRGVVTDLRLTEVIGQIRSWRG